MAERIVYAGAPAGSYLCTAQVFRLFSPDVDSVTGQ